MSTDDDLKTFGEYVMVKLNSSDVPLPYFKSVLDSVQANSYQVPETPDPNSFNMAMSNSNYGYPTPGYSSPYSSTPSNIRTQRPRFGYSGPSLYPRPRSSASKPNPDSYSDSMINNYGNSNSRIDVSFNSENENSSYDSYQQNSSSNYYSANDSFYNNQTNEDTSYMASDQNFMRNDSVPLRSDTSAQRDSSLMYGDYSGMVRNNPVMPQGVGYTARGGGQNSGGILPKPTSQYGTSNYTYSNSYGLGNAGNYKGNFKKPQSASFGFGDNTNKAPFNRKFGKAKRKMAAPTMTQSAATFRCILCSLDFKSQIPYDMHLGGARHAKKLKAKEALSAVQSQCSTNTSGVDGEKSYFCDLCNVKANSLLQLHNHLEGSKHKNKLNPKEKTEDGSKESGENKEIKKEKTNGSLTRPLPSEFGEPQPAKLTKFSCEICSISVNSEVQLQQHLSSKKHQNKVEGKPVVKKRKSNLLEKSDGTTTEEPGTDDMEVVVGVKTLSSSFVQGETLQ